MSELAFVNFNMETEAFSSQKVQPTRNIRKSKTQNRI